MTTAIRAKLALALILAATASAGCNRPPGLEYFPKAALKDAAPSGIAVEWWGELAGIRPLRDRERPGAVYVDASGRWALIFHVLDADPEAGPFEARHHMTVVVASPPGFFGDNAVRIGRGVNVTMAVWRDADGRLRARVDKAGPLGKGPARHSSPARPQEAH